MMGRDWGRILGTGISAAVAGTLAGVAVAQAIEAMRPIPALLGAWGPITSRPGDPRPGGRLHAGWDVAVPVGTPVYAPWPGQVRIVRDLPLLGLGIGVREESTDGARGVIVGHLQRVIVRDGAHVQAGDLIAYTGDSGVGTGPHAHVVLSRHQHGRYLPAPPSILPGGLVPEVADAAV